MHPCNTPHVMHPPASLLRSALPWCSVEPDAPRGREARGANRAGRVGAGGRLLRALRTLTLGAAVGGGTTAQSGRRRDPGCTPQLAEVTEPGGRDRRRRGQAGLHYPASLAAFSPAWPPPTHPWTRGAHFTGMGRQRLSGWVPSLGGFISPGDPPFLISALPLCAPFPFMLRDTQVVLYQK